MDFQVQDTVRGVSLTTWLLADWSQGQVWQYHCQYCPSLTTKVWGVHKVSHGYRRRRKNPGVAVVYLEAPWPCDELLAICGLRDLWWPRGTCCWEAKHLPEQTKMKHSQHKNKSTLITTHKTVKQFSKHVQKLFSLFHPACCRVTQLLHQPLHICKIYKILHIKKLKMLWHVLVLRPSSGSYIFLAKVTLEIVTH